MTSETTPQSAGWRMKVSAFALAAAIFAVLWFAIAALGTKWGWWPWQVGLGQMTIGTGPMITMIALGLSIIAQIIALIKAPRVRPFIIALLATLISAMALFRLGGFGAQAAALPPIHDIQTDWSNPVMFSDSLITMRKETASKVYTEEVYQTWLSGDDCAASPDPNPVLAAPLITKCANARWPGMGGKLVSVAQEEAETKGEEGETVYPPLDPVYFDQSPAEVAAIAERIITSKGWEVVTPLSGQESSDTIQLEATATSGWFEFKDDVAIRIRAVEGATRVDMRSTSRVGLSDIGANSKRVYGFMMELLDRGDGRVED